MGAPKDTAVPIALPTGGSIDSTEAPDRGHIVDINEPLQPNNSEKTACTGQRDSSLLEKGPTMDKLTRECEHTTSSTFASICDSNSATDDSDTNTISLSLVTFNCKNVETSYTAISTLLSDAHFVFIQEHWLFNYQLKQMSLFDENVCGTGKAVDDSDPILPIQKPRGYGGVGILWRKSLDHLVTVLEDGSELIQCVRVKTAEGLILIISVCMPSKGKGDNISEFQDCILVYQIQEIIQKYYDHFIFIGGDLNEDLTLPSHSKRKEKLVRFIDEYTGKLSTVAVGPTFIHPNGKDCSTIDYFIFRDTSGVDVNITCCNTLASNTSDLHPIKCVTNISAIEAGSVRRYG